MEDTISIAKKQYSELLGGITTKQGERDRLLAEIDQYESIGKETQAAVRQKIADAQKIWQDSLLIFLFSCLSQMRLCHT